MDQLENIREQEQKITEQKYFTKDTELRMTV